MRYINAAEVLPEELLTKVQAYVSGEVLYIPNDMTKKVWGEKSGSRKYYKERNANIKAYYANGKPMEDIAKEFGLAYDTVRKIIYSQTT